MNYIQLCLFDCEEVVSCSNNYYHKSNSNYKLYGYLYSNNPSNEEIGQKFRNYFRQVCDYICGYSSGKSDLFAMSEVNTYKGRLRLFPYSLGDF